MKLSIVIPAHNEEENLPPLMDSIINLVQSMRWDAEIIIVNDHSTDNTIKIVESYIAKYPAIIKLITRNDGRRGMGHTLIEGTREAKGDYVLWTMADRSDDIDTYPRIINALKDYDMVFGSRYIRDGSRGDLEYNKAVASSAYSRLARFIFKLPVHDITNAFRGFKKDIFNKVKLVSGDFAISPEFAIKAHLAGFKLGEVPTTYINRKAGKTNFKMLKMGLRYASLFKYRLIR
jgi:dolichol-phosphate mannosyltransferase